MALYNTHYQGLKKSIVTDIPLEGGSGVCQGKTKKGESCPNKAKNGTTFCGKHTP